MNIAVVRPPLVQDEQITVSSIEGNGDLRVTPHELLANDVEFGVGTNTNLSIFSVQNPVGGSVTLSAGDVMFSPAPGYQGQPQFE